jgi:ribonuclease P protein component
MAIRCVANESAALTRYGFVIAKRVGNAVVRNRVRRRLREILRSLPINEGFDVVITARPEAAEVSFADLRTELTLLLKRSRLLTNAPA